MSTKPETSLNMSETSVDVTEHKRVEDALRRSEAYLAESQKPTRTGSWAFSRIERKTVYWSDEQFRMWGFDPREGVPDPQAVLERVHPDDRERIRELFDTGFEGRLGPDVVTEHRIVLPDGTVKYVHGTSHPVLDDGGQVIGYSAPGSM